MSLNDLRRIATMKARLADLARAAADRAHGEDREVASAVAEEAEKNALDAAKAATAAEQEAADAAELLGRITKAWPSMTPDMRSAVHAAADHLAYGGTPLVAVQMAADILGLKVNIIDKAEAHQRSKKQRATREALLRSGLVPPDAELVHNALASIERLGADYARKLAEEEAGMAVNMLEARDGLKRDRLKEAAPGTGAVVAAAGMAGLVGLAKAFLNPQAQEGIRGE